MSSCSVLWGKWTASCAGILVHTCHPTSSSWWGMWWVTGWPNGWTVSTSTTGQANSCLSTEYFRRWNPKSVGESISSRRSSLDPISTSSSFGKTKKATCWKSWRSDESTTLLDHLPLRNMIRRSKNSRKWSPCHQDSTYASASLALMAPTWTIWP